MIELLAVGIVGIVLLAVFGLLAAVFSLLWWVLLLPFKLLAFTFKAFGALLALPFLLVFGVLGVLLFGVGLFAFAFPALPLLLVALGLWAIFRRRDRSSASVV